MNIQTDTDPLPHEVSSMVSLFNQGQFGKMEAYARGLAARFPNHGLSWQAIGVAILNQGRFSDSLKPLQKAAMLLPNDAQTHNNLANTYVKLGRLPDADASYLRALELSPTFAEAHFNRGNTLVKLGQPDEAEISYRKALTIRPDFVEALCSLALLYMAKNKWMDAFGTAFKALQIKESWETKSIFVKCLTEVEITSATDDLRSLVVRALSEPWGAASHLTRVSTEIIKLNPAIRSCMTRANEAWPERLSAQALYESVNVSEIADDAVLRALLVVTPIGSIELERFLTMIRSSMLEAATSSVPVLSGNSIMGFYSALARQCFVNEYVFSWTESEAEKAHGLRDALVKNLQNCAPVSELSLVTVAAYFPLYSLPFADRLFKSVWSNALTAVLDQQVREPTKEAALRTTLPQLTPIENAVSLMVQNQYEENPYPRWVKVSPAGQSFFTDDYIRQRFPLASYQPTLKGNRTTILIAGCGTGRHSIETALLFPHAQVLAIDLSLTSLSYAKRKTQELGLTSISYAQADIMKLGEIDRKFDIIESAGVLHHLADPLAGWNILLSRLRNGGLMRLGFYSEIARRNIVRAQKLIKEQGCGSSHEDIRQYRQLLMNSDHANNFEPVLQSRDFFSTSSCRDLLSHVQEHRFTLIQIQAFLKKYKLRFIGFDVGQNILHAYQVRFPDDQAAINLGNWHIFENENPDIFLDMYQFWVQK